MFGISFVSIFAFLYVYHLYPFGNGSFATADANIQYIDFFSYLKDVFSGDNSISYTFSDTLGGDALAVFSYYLASPFNLLLLFFQKSQILTFFNVAAALKLCTCAVTASIFLCNRFEKKLKPVFIVIFSLSYAFMQYNIEQIDNIMWLDGVYMLPLMLLGVYKAVNERNIILLSVSTGLCIIFNWYAAGICCLFSIIWFVFECALKVIDSPNGKFSFKDTSISVLLYGSGMVIAILLSAGLFLPTVISMLGGKGIDPNFSNGFVGNIINVVGKYHIGTMSENGSPVLFCGSVVIIGIFALFFAKTVSARHKILFGSMLFVSVIIYFWQPLFVLFSLLRSATSYWYRYAFVSIFAIIFIAAYYFAVDSIPERTKNITFAALTFASLLLLLNYVRQTGDLTRIYYTVAFVAITAALLLFIFRKRSRGFSIVLVCVLILELGLNAKYILETDENLRYGIENQSYQIEQQKQIEEIKAADDDFYRISQTSLRTRAAYNDSMAYNFASNAGYTSCPDNLQIEFLDKLGYRLEGSCITVVNTSIIAADSLLGINMYFQMKA